MSTNQHVHNRTVSSVNSFSFNICIISPMISKYLILMSMTCVETAGNDPTPSMLRPPSPFQIPLIMITALTIVFQVTVIFSQAGDRFLPSCCRCGLSFRIRNFFPTMNTSLFHGCPVHLVNVEFGSSSWTGRSKPPSATHRNLGETVHQRISIKV